MTFSESFHPILLVPIIFLIPAGIHLYNELNDPIPTEHHVGSFHQGYVGELSLPNMSYDRMAWNRNIDWIPILGMSHDRKYITNEQIKTVRENLAKLDDDELAMIFIETMENAEKNNRPHTDGELIVLAMIYDLDPYGIKEKSAIQGEVNA